jgi:hypothetical protein
VSSVSTTSIKICNHYIGKNRTIKKGGVKYDSIGVIMNIFCGCKDREKHQKISQKLMETFGK